MTSDDILNKRFERATVGGYRADDVNAFMVTLADSLNDKSVTLSSQITTLNKDKENLQNKLVILANKLEEYRSDEDSMRTALVGAQKLGDSIVKDSKEKAESLLENAVAEAERIVAQAHNDAQKISSTAKAQCESETLALERTKREASQFKKKLLAMYQQHIDLIELLPEAENIPAMPPPLTTNIPRKAPDIQDNNFASSIIDEISNHGELNHAEPIVHPQPEIENEIVKSDVKQDKNFEPLQFGAGFRLANDE